MYREITLKQADGTEKLYKFLANGATTIRYRQVFKEDLLVKLHSMDLEKGEFSPDADLGFVDRLAFIMNAAAEKKDMNHLSFEAFIDWLSDIESGEMLEHMEEIVLMYVGNKATGSDLKKRAGRPRGE